MVELKDYLAKASRGDFNLVDKKRIPKVARGEDEALDQLVGLLNRITPDKAWVVTESGDEKLVSSLRTKVQKAVGLGKIEKGTYQVQRRKHNGDYGVYVLMKEKEQKRKPVAIGRKA